MALPKWMEDFLNSEAVKNLVKLAVLTATVAILNHFQAAEIKARVKKSENLIQQTVVEQAVGVASAVTNAPPAEVAPVVEAAAAEVE